VPSLKNLIISHYFIILVSNSSSIHHHGSTVGALFLSTRNLPAGIPVTTMSDETVPHRQ
jgi:hypothetical protein